MMELFGKPLKAGNLTEIYNRLRRNIMPSSKNDLDWRVGELTLQLDRIEELLGGPHSGRFLKNDSGNHYQLARAQYGYMLTFSSDMVIGRSLREHGCFQEDDIEKAIELLEKNNIYLKRNVFLDVGSNIGTHTIYALRHGFQKAICIEADSENYRLLKINQLLNGFDDRCINVCAAASSSSGVADIELSPINFGDHRISFGEPSINVHEEKDWKKKAVLTETLDKLIEGTKVPITDISLAWIDTQGHEGHVLSGGSNFLASSVPFVAEFWPYGLERSGGWKLLRDIFSETKREIYDLRRSINEGSLVRLSVNDLDSLYEHFLKEEKKLQCAHTDLIVV